jgi:hypothetical protein
MASTSHFDLLDLPVRDRPQPLRALLVRLNQASLDRRLAEGAGTTESPAVALRARQLSDPRTARMAAERLEAILREIDRPRSGVSARAPLQRAQIIAARPFVAGLVDRLRETDDPRPAGVAQAMVLLTDGAGAIYAPAHPGTLAAQAWRAAHAL